MMLEKLKNEVLHSAEQAPHTPMQYEELSRLIHARTGERVSPTTLKRFFGYLNESVRPRLITLNILSRFIGYADFEAFTKRGGDADAQSNIIFGEHLSADKLEEGERISLSWLPDRRCVIRHLGNARFEVTEAENTKLRTGDTFTCHLFVKNEPLYMEYLVRNGAEPGCFVAGKKDGIRVKKL